MFEVGAKYEFRMIEGNDEILFWGTIELYDHPLIKLQDSEPFVIKETGTPFLGREDHDADPISGRIINVTSPNFIGAIRQSARNDD